MARNKQSVEKTSSGDAPETGDDTGVAKNSQGGSLPMLVADHAVHKRQPGRRSRIAPKPLEDEDGEPVARVEPPVARRYKVTKGGRTADNGLPQNLTTGKVISDVQYNIEALIAQGIELEELGAPEPAEVD